MAGAAFTWDDGDVYLPSENNPGSSAFVLRGTSAEAGGNTRRLQAAALQPLIEQFASGNAKALSCGSFHRFYVVGLNDDFVRDLGGTLYLLFSAVALLLAIGCGNVSILLLARGTARQHEFAVRTAIGATRRRLIRQLLTESLLLSLTGAILGVLLAYRALSIIVEMLPKYSFPHEAAIQINLPVLVFSVGAALLTGIFSGCGRHCSFRGPRLAR